MFSMRGVLNRRFKLWRNKKDPQKITKLKTFICKYIWERNNYPPEKDRLM